MIDGSEPQAANMRREKNYNPVLQEKRGHVGTYVLPLQLRMVSGGMPGPTSGIGYLEGFVFCPMYI